jgi:hypothetical protein
VTVTIPFNELRNGLVAGQIGNATLNGQQITPNTARMLACDANIIPAVLGGRGEVLDLGRSQRSWSTAQRRARRIEDDGCGWPGCQAPLERCRIHHLAFWGRLGKTNLKNGLHLCQFHYCSSTTPPGRSGETSTAPSTSAEPESFVRSCQPAPLQIRPTQCEASLGRCRSRCRAARLVTNGPGPGACLISRRQILPERPEHLSLRPTRFEV